MTGVQVRDATRADLTAIARVAVAAGQDEEWSAADPAYAEYLLARGRVVVAVRDGSVIGFGAIRLIGTGAHAAAMLSDLFVHPRAHGSGCGRAMLTSLWEGTSRRMTFSSLHALALPLYTSFGLDAWWPLLYLSGDVRALPTPPGWTVSESAPEEVGALELEWAGADRTADHRAWASRPAGMALRAALDGQVLAAGTVAGSGREYGLVHLALAPWAGDREAGDAVMAVLASLAGVADAGVAGAGVVGDGDLRPWARGVVTPHRDRPGARAGLTPDGISRVCLPAPHPAVRPLLSRGWRVSEFDLFMATDPGLIDPRRGVPSPALA